MVNFIRPAFLDRLAFLLFLLFFLLVALASVDRSCLDDADSAYLISADAVSRGLVPYRDFLAAHPPLIYVIGAPLSMMDDGTLPFRVFSIGVLAALGVTVWRLAYKVTANSGIAMLAGVLTLFAPLGLFFSKLFTNDPLVSLLTALIFLQLFGRTRRSLIGAGVLSVLATLTKLTWLPVLAVCVLYVIFFRRKQAWVYLAVALGGSIGAALLMHLLTGGAYLDNILVSQVSKGYSFSNLGEGLRRIWSIDWPLIFPGAVGAWFAVRAIRKRQQLSPGLRGRLFLLAGWLVSGLVLLGTLPAEGHDTNLFLLAEPALAILAAWGIIGLAERGSLPAITAVAIWVVLAVPALVDRDRDFLSLSNSNDVDVVAARIISHSEESQPVLVPGCFALEAARPVTLDFYDRIFWEEKYKRGDREAIDMFNSLKQEVIQAEPGAVLFAGDLLTKEILIGDVRENYRLDYRNRSRPDLELWVPGGAVEEFC
ncbi:MAG: glycosyltransferase family 39 protein [Thermoleophilia bacterium]|nr:glycosyltransferase family 39 protein [Thermoleophilia bacterium]